jgi:hypothetical protein
VGENKHRRIIFDISTERAMYPDATFSLINRPSWQDGGYPVANIDVENDKVYWTVLSSDLRGSGLGTCELICRQGETIAKSIFYKTDTHEALDETGELPQPWDAWQTVLSDIRDETVAAAEAVENLGVIAYTVPAGSEAQVTKVIDEHGAVTLIFDIPQGEKGAKGDKGDKGDPGNKGDKGDPGKKGDTGDTGATFTPSVDQSGIISWSNDKTLPNPQSVDIVSLVLNALPTWNGGKY